MTDLQKMYLQARAARKRGHHAALRHIARQIGVDAATVDRCLRRARREDEMDAKRARRDKAQEAAA